MKYPRSVFFLNGRVCRAEQRDFSKRLAAASENRKDARSNFNQAAEVSYVF